MVVMIHSIVTAHFFFSWPFDNLCPTNAPLTDNGVARAAQIGADASQRFEQCLQLSDSLLPPTERQAWFQAGDDQVNLVAFFNVISILTIVYICVAYFGSDSFLGIYSLFYCM